MRFVDGYCIVFVVVDWCCHVLGESLSVWALGRGGRGTSPLTGRGEVNTIVRLYVV